MKPSSRVLMRTFENSFMTTILSHSNILDEIVLLGASRDRDPRSAAEDIMAPVPLLSNYGVGKIIQYYQDMNMLCSLNSKERTLQEFIDLG